MWNNLLVRAGAAQQDAGAVRAGRGECRVSKCQAAQPLDQGIGQTRQQLPERVGPEAGTGRPIGKEIQLDTSIYCCSDESYTI